MNEYRRSCAHCQATRTPLWRTGPAGPRSLCNACGIRYRKRKAAMEGGAREGRGGAKQSSDSTTSSSYSWSYDGQSMKFGGPGSPLKKQRNGGKVDEVEEAAFLLMSLSCDPVFA